ncbi:hypothetical protein JXA05_04250 [Candidatus Peregrinibacteria bacterium]|nr:hypothetical protein [Candidatus Peregrinibacteria bacterium]
MLSQVQPPENNLFFVAQDGIERFFREVDLTENESLRAASAIAHRREFDYPNIPRPQKPVRNILRLVLSADASESQRYPFLQMTKGELADSLVNVSAAQDILLKGTAPVIVPIDDQISLHIEYDKCHWEGLGAVYFHGMRQNNPREKTPLFIVRGNPFLGHKGQGIGFAVRTVQPWASENAPSIKHTKEGTHGWEQEDPSRLEEIRRVIAVRQTLEETIKRRLLRGPNLYNQKVNPSEQRIFLLMALAYLQKYGVTQFKGIDHRYHPQAILGNKKGFHSNYNQLFSGVMEYRGKDNLYPHELDMGRSGCYIPDYFLLPAALRMALMNIFER